MYKFLISLIILDVILCLIFASLSAFFSIQLAFFANTLIPLISYIKLKKSLPKFQIACMPRFFLYNPLEIELPKKGIKESLKHLKYFNVFINLYKFFAYIIFIILTGILIKNNLFHVSAFFVSSILILLSITILKAKNG